MSDEKKTQPVAWLFEDTLPEEYPYDAMWLHSEVRGGVRMFPVYAPGAKPVQEPVAKVELMTNGGNAGLATRIVEIDDHLRERLRPGQLLYTAPPQRQPLTYDQIRELGVDLLSVRAIERAHGIGGEGEA